MCSSDTFHLRQPPSQPPTPATGILYLGMVVYLHDPPMERRRRGRVREEMMFLLSGPDYLFIHLCLALAALIGVVSPACVCVCVCEIFILCVLAGCRVPISCVKVSRPGGSYMKEPMESLWRTNRRPDAMPQVQNAHTHKHIHSQRLMPHTHWLAHTFTHADTPHPQPTIHKSPSLHTPVGQA